MFSLLTTNITRNVTNMSNGNIIFCRGLYWIRNEGETKSIGIDSDMVSVFEGIKNINFEPTTRILKGEPLFSIESDTSLSKVFISKYDCIIVCKNRNAINTINKNPEDSWILKIKDFNQDKSYSKFVYNPNTSVKERENAFNKFYNSNSFTPYNYDNNSIDTKQFINEKEKINYMIGNH